MYQGAEARSVPRAIEKMAIVRLSTVPADSQDEASFQGISFLFILN